MTTKVSEQELVRVERVENPHVQFSLRMSGKLMKRRRRNDGTWTPWRYASTHSHPQATAEAFKLDPFFVVVK